MRKTQATIDKLAASLPLVTGQRDIRQALDSEDQAQFQIWETAMRIFTLVRRSGTTWKSAMRVIRLFDVLALSAIIALFVLPVIAAFYEHSNPALLRRVVIAFVLDIIPFIAAIIFLIIRHQKALQFMMETPTQKKLFEFSLFAFLMSLGLVVKIMERQ